MVDRKTSGCADGSCPFKNFNKHFKNFVRELGKTYPDVTEYKWMIAGYKIFKTISKKLPYKIFQKNFNESIREAAFKKDEGFFLDPAFTIGEYDNVAQMIKREWPRMDAHTREMVWQHLQCIIVLGDKCKEAQARAPDASDA